MQLMSWAWFYLWALSRYCWKRKTSPWQLVSSLVHQSTHVTDNKLMFLLLTIHYVIRVCNTWPNRELTVRVRILLGNILSEFHGAAFTTGICHQSLGGVSLRARCFVIVWIRNSGNHWKIKDSVAQHPSKQMEKVVHTYLGSFRMLTKPLFTRMISRLTVF